MKGFRTKTELKKYVNSKVYSVGPTESLKIKDKEFFDFCLEFFKGHSDYERKVRDLQDITITENTLKKGSLQLNILRSDKTTEAISRDECISPSKRGDIFSALRVAINSQTLEFKLNNPHVCELCKTNDNQKEYHVDHVIHFEKLAKDFLNDNPNPPSSFVKDIYNRQMFKQEDMEYEMKWFEFHKKNATLRILCDKCNLTRKKFT